jgi:hypothetical protein
MKTFRIKMVTGVCAAFMMMGAGTAGANESAVPAREKSSVGPVTQDRFDKTNQAIRQDLQHIALYREHIRFLKEKIRHDRRADNRIAVQVDKKELLKMKSELKKQKRYLKADKRDLRRDYRLAIREREQVMKQHKQRLSESKKLERQQDKTVNYTTPNDDMVALYQRDLDSDRQALKELKKDRAENLLQVNRDIRKSKGEFFVINYAEGGVVGISNWMKK